MVRVAGVNLPSGKHVWVSLTYIYGVGKPLALKLCAKHGVNPARKIDDLSEKELDLLREDLKNYLIEGDLRREVSGSIKMMSDINCYRGTRHKKKLPVRGQRTKTNAKTRKGRGVAIAGKKIATK